MKHPIAAACLAVCTLAVPLFAQPSPGVSHPDHPGQWIWPSHHRRPVMSPRGPVVQLPTVEARIEIIDQVATTVLELTLLNPSATGQEAVLIFPVQDGVTVRAVQYDGVGPEPTAKLLTKDEARRIYDEIVREARDPALVEFIGMNLIRTSVFPIPPGGTQKLRLTFEQVLASDGGRVEYILPRSNSFADPACAWNVEFEVRSKAQLVTVYSPTHSLNITENQANRARGRISGIGSAVGTIRLAYLVKQESNAEPAFTVIAYPDAEISQTGGGYFMVLGGVPSRPPDETPRAREVVIVFDRSGSMRGEKLRQAQAAAEQVIEGLREGEAFNIIDYSDSVRSYAQAPVLKTAQTAREAKEYIAAMRAEGGTNIHDALLEALRPEPTAGMLPLVLFLTDGLPTIGERDEGRLRSALKAANTSGRRIFSFGVGFDVNTPLLTALSAQSRAMSTFVLPSEDVEVKVSRVFRGLSGPVMAAPTLTALDADGSVTTRRIRDVMPADLPDFFEGDQVLLCGAYVGDAPLTLRIRGDVGGVERACDIRFDPRSASTRHDYVPRMWASRRIASLLDEVRQAGASGGTTDARMKELTDEIVRLSVRYGVLTEYTAFLAVETTDFRADHAPVIRGRVEEQVRDRIANARTGIAAVNQEANLKQMQSAGGGKGKEVTAMAEPPPPGRQTWLDDRMNTVTIRNVLQVGDRTLYQRKNRWVDGRLLDRESEAPDETVEFGTEAYMTLAEQLKRENRLALLAQGGDLLLLVGNKSVLVRQP